MSEKSYQEIMKKDQSQFLSLVLWGNPISWLQGCNEKRVRIYSAPLLPRKHNFLYIRELLYKYFPHLASLLYEVDARSA